MDTLIPTSADLAGDPGRDLARRGACGPPSRPPRTRSRTTRRLPPALLDRLHEQKLFRLLLPRIVERHRDRSRHLLPRDRDHRPRRRLDRLVPEPGRRLRHVGGLSRPAGGAGDLRQRPARRAGLGPGPEGQGRRDARAATRSPASGPSPRAAAMPPGSAPIARSSRPTARAARRRRQAGRAHHAGARRATCSGPTSGTRSACAARRPTSSPSPTISCAPIIRSPRDFASRRRNAASPGRSTACRR